MQNMQITSSVAKKAKSLSKYSACMDVTRKTPFKSNRNGCDVCTFTYATEEEALYQSALCLKPKDHKEPTATSDEKERFLSFQNVTKDLRLFPFFSFRIACVLHCIPVGQLLMKKQTFFRHKQYNLWGLFRGFLPQRAQEMIHS